ncbi:MAG: hypothetical protein IT301_08760 [Dehalococcoidia bacterium]|nr:hypothetical protein [Dehalococcoidia bacterium]
MKTFPLESVAYHEAGHAAMARHLNVAVHSVSIVPDDGSLGRVQPCALPRGFRPDLERSAATESRIRRLVMVCLAGHLAEKQFRASLGKRAPSSAGAIQDHTTAVDLIEWLVVSEREAEAYINWLLVKTQHLLEQDWIWRSVEHIARALIEEREISARRLNALWKESND